MPKAERLKKRDEQGRARSAQNNHTLDYMFARCKYRDHLQITYANFQGKYTPSVWQIIHPGQPNFMSGQVKFLSWLPSEQLDFAEIWTCVNWKTWSGQVYISSGQLYFEAYLSGGQLKFWVICHTPLELYTQHYTHWVNPSPWAYIRIVKYRYKIYG